MFCFRRFSLVMGGALALSLGAASVGALEMMTYTYMDKNKDGKVTRKEWTSSTNSFKARDWNGDGVLTGDELRVGYKGKKDDLSFDEIVQVRFEELDLNRDGAISLWEWRSKKEYFEQLDDNGDKVLTRVEFHDRRDETPDAFTSLDKNRNGVLSKKESKLDKERFNELDDNRDGNLTRNEYFDKRPSNQYSFTALDRNRDGIVSIYEWRGEKSEFDRLDIDNNNLLTQMEFLGQAKANRPGIK